MKSTVAFLFAAVMAVSASTAANATVTFSLGPVQAGAQVDNLDSVTPGTLVSPTTLNGIDGAQLTGSGAQFVTGSSSGVYAAPFGDISQYLSVQGGGSV